ncbi:MAG TPA: hypothetical protein PKN48_00935 [Bacteroidales bacterium]|nr:hypothetical protein [Bacteroidales bacterium]
MVKLRSKDYYKNVVLPDTLERGAGILPATAAAAYAMVKGKKNLVFGLGGVSVLGALVAGHRANKRDQKWLGEHGIKRNYFNTKFERLKSE